MKYKKSKYVVLEIENMDNGKFDYTSWDVYLEDKTGNTFVAEFEKRSDALLFSRIKNRKKKGKRIDKIEKMLFKWYDKIAERDNHKGEIMSTDLWALAKKLPRYIK